MDPDLLEDFERTATGILRAYMIQRPAADGRLRAMRPADVIKRGAPRQPTVPPDRLCWLIDVENALERLSTIHPKAAEILISIVLDAERYRDVQRRYGVAKMRDVPRIAEEAVVSFVMDLTARGVPTNHRETLRAE